MVSSSSSSQTANEYIASQLSLEAEAKLALPYQFNTCTKPLGPLRQNVYACLTCSPPSASIHQQSTPAGICYSCSISCHGEHNLVELFTKRNFVCDCGSRRLANSGVPCSLMVNSSTGGKVNAASTGGKMDVDILGDEAHAGNKYNHNYQGKFCGCGEEYHVEVERGTMFQCLGLGNVEDGGCGEDWWHPECLMGLSRERDESNLDADGQGADGQGLLERRPQQQPLPLHFPDEDDFDHLICYKCVKAFPWIKQYAGTRGFLPALPHGHTTTNCHTTTSGAQEHPTETAESKKRKADDLPDIAQDALKKVKSEDETPASDSTSNSKPTSTTTVPTSTTPKHASLPPPPTGPMTLLVREDFRDHLCRCPSCFPRLAKHPQLLEEEDTYEPPVSEDGEPADGARSVGSGSLLDRGEAALSSIDRVRAIEGVMAYNHLKDKLKPFLKQYADSGEAVGAEHINAFFAKLRGDEQAMREAAAGANSGREVEKDGRRDQDGL